IEGASRRDGASSDGTAGVGADGMVRLSRVPGVPALSYPIRHSADGGGTWSVRVPLTDLVAASGLRAPGVWPEPGGRPVLVGEAGAGWRVTLDDSAGEPLELPVLAGFAGLRHTVD